jgi:hypothetical protein
MQSVKFLSDLPMTPMSYEQEYLNAFFLLGDIMSICEKRESYE